MDNNTKNDQNDAILDDVHAAGETSDEGDNASQGSKGTTVFPEDPRRLYRIDAHEYVVHARLFFEFIVQCPVIAR